jgi:hypothetical protein
MISDHERGLREVCDVQRKEIERLQVLLADVLPDAKRGAYIMNRAKQFGPYGWVFPPLRSICRVIREAIDWDMAADECAKKQEAAKAAGGEG